MHKHDREVMIKDLRTLGLHQKLLDNFSDDIISRLFEMIGWAAPSFKPMIVEAVNSEMKKKIISDDKNITAEGECEHKEVVAGENYYGKEEHQYTTYYYCEECGEEMEDDG